MPSDAQKGAPERVWLAVANDSIWVETTVPALAHASDVEYVKADAVAQLVEALERIETWSRAYPLEVFPEPDFKRAHELLKAGGMTLDAISASILRRAVTDLGEIARTALSRLSPEAPK